MNLNEAIGHASTIFMPEFLFGADEAMLKGEQAANEEALYLLISFGGRSEVSTIWCLTSRRATV